MVKTSLMKMSQQLQRAVQSAAESINTGHRLIDIDGNTAITATGPNSRPLLTRFWVSLKLGKRDVIVCAVLSTLPQAKTA